MTVNKVILIGNLGQDPEVRNTGSGTAVANLRVATTERRKVGDAWQDHTEWHSVAVFGKTAENAARYLSKGRQVYVEGRLQTRKYKDRDGNDRYSYEVVADQVRYLGGGGSEAGGRAAPSQGGSRGSGGYGGGGNQRGGDTYYAAAEPYVGAPNDDDIPF